MRKSFIDSRHAFFVVIVLGLNSKDHLHLIRGIIGFFDKHTAMKSLLRDLWIFSDESFLSIKNFFYQECRKNRKGETIAEQIVDMSLK